MYLLKKFSLSYPVWATIIGTFISRFGTSIILPYITVVLTQSKGLPIYWAGIAIGGNYLAQSLSGFLSGMVSTKFNCFRIIKTSLLIYAFLFLLMGLSCQYLTNKFYIGCIFILCCFFGGVCRSFIETVGQIIISHFSTIDKKHLAFSLRYIAINIGISLGPIFAYASGIIMTNQAFWVTALFITFYFVLLQTTINVNNFVITKKKKASFSTAIKTLMQDKQFLCFAIAAIFATFGFNQMETLFAYISLTNTGSTHIFAFMYFINGITIVTLQVQLIKFIRRFDIHNVIITGISLIVCGLIGIAFSGKIAYFYYISMVIFTLGEILALSVIGLYIDLLAPSQHKEVYFGLYSFSWIGITLFSPFITLICHYFGYQAALLTAASFTCLGLPFILFAKNAYLNKDEKEIGNSIIANLYTDVPRLVRGIQKTCGTAILDPADKPRDVV